jgi:hypothetical protein
VTHPTCRYEDMVSDITVKERAAKANRNAILPTFRLQASFGLHVIVTMGTFFAIGWYAGKVSFDSPAAVRPPINHPFSGVQSYRRHCAHRQMFVRHADDTMRRLLPQGLQRRGCCVSQHAQSYLSTCLSSIGCAFGAIAEPLNGDPSASVWPANVVAPAGGSITGGADARRTVRMPASQRQLGPAGALSCCTLAATHAACSRRCYTHAKGDVWLVRALCACSCSCLAALLLPQHVRLRRSLGCAMITCYAPLILHLVCRDALFSHLPSAACLLQPCTLMLCLQHVHGHVLRSRPTRVIALR